jgi:hypothetical protein
MELTLKGDSHAPKEREESPFEKAIGRSRGIVGPPVEEKVGVPSGRRR